MTPSTLETVQQYQQLLGSGNQAWIDLIADDISFTGPVEQINGKADFIALNTSFFPLVRGYQAISALEQDNQAVLEGEFTVATPGGNEIQLNIVEIYELALGKIQNIRVYYDAEEFRKEFAQ